MCQQNFNSRQPLSQLIGTAILRVHALLYAGVFVLTTIATALRAQTPPEHYYYQGQKVKLELDGARLAVRYFKNLPLSQRLSAAATASVPAVDSEPTGVERWHLSHLQTPVATATDAHREIAKLISSPNVEFASPVFHGREGGWVIMTPEVLIRFKPEHAAAARAILATVAPELQVVTENFGGMAGAYILRSASKNGFEVLAGANRLAEDPRLEWAEPEAQFTVTPDSIPNDPGMTNNWLWGMRNAGQVINGITGTADRDMDGDLTWDLTTGAANITVLIIDNGVQQNHPDINQLPGNDFTGQNSGGGPVNACDNHGTAVAGCVSAIINNNLGTVGIAPGCRILSARVMRANVTTPCTNQNTTQSSWTVNALNWGQAQGARVSNNSNSYGVTSSAINTAYQNTYNAGMVHFASAGNNSSSTIGYPASLAVVNAVAALNNTGARAGFSNFGNGLDFSAPGQDIYTTDRTGTAGYNNASGAAGDYAWMNGTSFASPYAAGVAALVLSWNPSFTAVQVEAAMQSSCIDLGTTGYDTNFGWGFVNARFAISPQMAGDECNQAVVVPNGSFHTSFSTVFASPNPTDPLLSCGAGGRGRTVWFTLTPPASNTFTLNTYGSAYNTVLGLYTGSCGALTEVACNDDAAGGIQSEIVTTLQAGVNYLIHVAEFNNADRGGQLSFKVQPVVPPAPPNNLTATATSVSQIQLFWNDNSGDELGFKIERKTGATGVYAEITTVGAEVNTYHDAGLDANTTYFYQVCAYNNGGNSAYSNEASATTHSPPVTEGDGCTRPWVVPSMPFIASVNTSFATTAPGDPQPGCSDGGRGKTVWYYFTPAATTYVSINTFGSDYDTVLGLFTGACDALTEVACNGDAQGGLQSEIIYQLQAGVAYRILVGDFNNPGIGGNLVFNLQALPPPTISSFNPTSGAAGTTVTITGNNFTGATHVAFNGAAASSFTVNSNTQISAVVPTGATTGKISVTIPGGAATSANDFVILPPFTDMAAPLMAALNSSVAWGDYDSDGDLDILLTGWAGSSSISKIYRNDAGSFVDIAAALTGVSSSSAAWGDYDNDGDLDILLTGWAVSSGVSKVYRNDAGSFVDIAAALTNVNLSAAAWGDYDNDGDLDILLTGNTGTSNISKVYRNDAGSFVDIAAALTGVGQGAVAWGDYDNDGDLDILLTGSGSSAISRIYRNDAGSFVDIAAALTGVGQSSVAWGDYDNDGDLDILLTGNTGSSAISKVYRNNAGSFVDISAALAAVAFSSVAWGDYDNDGDLDILLTGSGSSGVSKVYRNDAGSFVDIAAALTIVNGGSVAWGDYDNDGDLDILLTGSSSSGSTSKVYRNNSAIANTAPAAPANLAATVSGSSVTFSWNKATDSQTPQNGLTYNLRLGTSSPSGVQKVSPMANVSNGYRRVPKLGNTNHRNSWTIKNLPNGTFFWSAQAIDHGFASSAFAAEKSFTIGGGSCTNIALNKTATASNSKSSNTPNKAVDGSTSTYWRSSSGGTQWWQVDLSTGALSYSQFTIKWKSSRHAKNYEIRVSNNSSFTTYTTVYTKTGGTGRTETITLTGAPRTERYVRLHMTKVNSSYYGVNEFEVCGFSSVTLTKNSADADEKTAVIIPTEMALHQNYPNPFNPNTTIRFDLPEVTHVRLVIYNMLGQVVRTLVDETQLAGYKRVMWDGRNEFGKQVSTGVYLYQLQVGRQQLVRRMIFQK